MLYADLSCSPSAATSRSPPAARGNSPCPRLAIPGRKRKKKKKRIRRCAKRVTAGESVDPCQASPRPPIPLHPSSLSSPSSSTPSTLPLSSSLSPPSGPTLLPTFVVRKRFQDRAAASLICEQVPDREAVSPFSCLLSYLRPQGLLLRLPLLTFLKQVVSCLSLALAPPACRRIRVLRPFWVLPCAAVLCSELMGSLCQPFWPSRYRCILPQPFRHLVLLLLDPLLRPVPRLFPLFPGNLASDVGYGPGEGPAALFSRSIFTICCVFCRAMLT